MIGLVVLLPYFLLHASHVYVTVLTQSSGENDRLCWPRETVFDWFGHGALVVGVLVIWLTLTQIPAAVLLEQVSPRSAFAAWLAAVWVIVPMSLCSTLAAPSRLMILHPPLIGRFLRQWRGLLFVHFITAQLFLFVIIGLWLMFIRHNPVGIFVVSIALPPALMVHARAWGRLAYLALNCDLPPARRKKRKKKAVIEEPALEVELEPIDDGDEVYALQPVRAAACERLVSMTEIQDEKLEFQRQRHERFGDPDPLDGPRAPTFESALGQHAFHFLFEVNTLGEWFSFSLTCLVTMALLQLTAAFFL